MSRLFSIYIKIFRNYCLYLSLYDCDEIIIESLQNETKLKFQLVRLLLIKKDTESLQDEAKGIKSQIDEYLRDKKAAIFLLERTQSQFKALSSFLEDIEQDILKMENIIQKKRAEYVVFEENISIWQKKRDCARVSLDNANKARDTNKRIIQELKDELKQIDNKLTELRKASQESTELSNSQVYYTLVISTAHLNIIVYEKNFFVFSLFHNKFLFNILMIYT